MAGEDRCEEGRGLKGGQAHPTFAARCTHVTKRSDQHDEPGQRERGRLAPPDPRNQRCHVGDRDDGAVEPSPKAPRRVGQDELDQRPAV